MAAVVSVGALTLGVDPAFAHGPKPGAEQIMMGTSTTAVTVSPNPSVTGQSVDLCATVTGSAPIEARHVAKGAGRTEDTGPTGTVTFVYPSGSQTAALSGAQACITVTVIATGTVTATYSGDGSFSGSTDSTSVTRDKADTTTAVTATPEPSSHGESVQVCATVTANAPGSGTPTGTVVFTGAGGFNQTEALNGSGEACVTSATLTGGTMTATYNGDTNYSASTGTTSVTVNRADTSTSVTVSPDPSVNSQSVDICATVAVEPPGSGTPTGTVTFNGPGGLVATAAVNGSGEACTARTDLSTGTVTGTYNGDGNFNASTGTASATVDPAGTTTVVTATPDPSTAGDAVMVCATVTADGPTTGMVAGTVTFSGAGLSDTKPLSAGVACSTSTTLSTGSITAAYNGTTGYSGSSDTTTVTVNEAPSNPIPPNPAPSAPSRPQTVTAVASASSVTVSWAAPASGAAVTGYTVTASPGPATCDTTTETTCVLGAVAGTSYTYTVIAHSAAGDSVASEPTAAVTPVAPVTPATPPTTNLNLTTTDGNITTAVPGQVVTFVGTGFAPYSTVVVTIYSTPIELGRVTTDATGSFQTPITLPQALAATQHTVVAQGAAPDGTVRSMALSVTVAAAPTVTAPVATGGGSLPVTGPPIGVLLLTGLVLAVTGAGLFRVGRRTA
ncbi:Ig-like domain repeat protein [Dactylosporangium sp. CS-047395]|uniref:Ig-like domain repeat protein n=1 Tax=Dactylosporangium sp. CS-047395 TaxID=3239936 RepID=UPI003D8E38AF